MNLRTKARFVLAGAVLVATAAVALAAGPAAQSGEPHKLVPPVAVTALQPLLPSPAGWTRERSNSDRIPVSDACSYSFADTLYANGDMRVRVTIADTGFGSDSLMTLAMLVATLPDDSVEEVPPATSIARLSYKGFPAATLWDAAKLQGEFTVLVGGRFVASVQGLKADGLDTLRGILDQIDLAKLADVR